MDDVAALASGRWKPAFVRHRGGPATIEWVAAAGPLHEPFFEASILRARRHPFNRAFAPVTPIEVLDDASFEDGAAEPAGLVFHLSRCGSTLVSQMLAAIDGVVAISEAQPLDAILHLSRAGASEAVTIRRLRAVVRAIAGPASGARVVLKMHAWHVLLMPLIERAFPSSPRVFLFREPRAVLASQARVAGFEVAPGAIDPRLLAGANLPCVSDEAPDGDTYGARVLAAFAAAGLANAVRTRYVDYAALPAAVAATIAPFFGLVPDAADLARMTAIAELDTKAGDGRRFASGHARRPTSFTTERLAREWLDAPHAALLRAAEAL